MATKPIVVLDPGHGPLSNPYPAATGYYEGTQMYKLALAIKAKLEANNITVIMTRNNINDNPDLTIRGKVAGTNEAALFISLHSDAAGSTIATAKGVTVFYSITDTTSNNKNIATNLANAVSTLMCTTNRAAKTKVGTNG